jgi:hypothetical protein
MGSYQFPWICYFAPYRRGSSGGRGSEEYLPMGIAHPTLEVAVLGGEAAFSIRKDALMNSHTGPTARREDDSPGLDEGFQQTFP